MKTNSCIYVMPLFPIFNKEEVIPFASFDKEHSSHLYASLLLNALDLLPKIAPNVPSVFCLDEKDREHLPAELQNGKESSLFFGDSMNIPVYLKNLSEKYFHATSNNLLLMSNAIGYTRLDLFKVFSLLSIEDECVVIGKTSKGKVGFMGFNSYSQSLFKHLDMAELNYDNLLQNVCMENTFLHVLDNFMTISGIDDFKKLYVELSKKESLAYCSQEMHEKFIHLFIEYKDLLK